MIGSYIGQYEIIEIIGSGGMSTVYKAYQPSHDRHVAIKVMPRQLSEDPTFLKRFQREAQVIAHLDHPSVIPIYEYGEHEGQPYIVMRLIEGGTLRKKLFYEYLDLPVIAHIVEQVASALDYAHSQGVIHRDLKPSNILLDQENNAFLTDFGIAKMLGSTSQVTGSGVVGTPSYMSPEQCQAKELTGQSDVYALGAILFEMLTGRPPYEADAPLSVMYKHVKDPIPTVTDILPNMPPEIDQIVRQALAKKTKDRYRNARALAADFRRYVEGQPIEYDRPPESVASPPSDFDRGPQIQAAQPTIARYEPVRRGVMPLVVGIIGLAVILALVGGGLAVLASANNQGSLIPTIPPSATKSSPTSVIGEITPTALESMTGATLTPTDPSPTNGAATNTPPPPTITPIVPSSATPTPTVPTSTPTPTNTSAPTDTPTPTNTPTLTPTLTLTPTSTSPPTGGTGLLAFNIGNNQNSEIAVVDANGQNFKTLTSNGAYDGEPDWSSDGGKIVFESERNGKMDIYTMSSSGANVQRLTNTPGIEERHPDWSPDGSVITFESRSGDETTLEIFVMNADGSNVLQLTGNAYGDRAPQFSPDGTQIAYMTRQRGKWEIAIMAYPGGQQVSIFNCPSLDCRFPTWSPDGTKIAFNTLDSSGSADQIWILTVATGQSTLLLDGPENGRPVWSGNGVFIFFNRTVSGNLDLYRVKVSTKEVERLTTDAKDEFAPDWGP